MQTRFPIPRPSWHVGFSQGQVQRVGLWLWTQDDPTPEPWILCLTQSGASGLEKNTTTGWFAADPALQIQRSRRPLAPAAAGFLQLFA
jgi:hypothetical protein